MTESEAINFFKDFIETLKINGEEQVLKNNYCKSANIAIQAIEKKIPKKPIEKVMPYSEEVGFNSEWNCPCCESYIGYFAEGMSDPEQMEYCNNCGQHIAKDWSDTD